MAPSNPPSAKSAACIKGVHGIRYQVKDVARAAAFYAQYLGFTLEHQHLPEFAAMSFGSATLLLTGPGASGSQPLPGGQRQEPGGWNRIVLHTVDLPACVAALQHAAVPFRTGIISGPGGSQVQIEDPDGNPVELFEPSK